MIQKYMTEAQKVLSDQDGLGQVWISGYQFARSIRQLQKQQIKAVCSCGDFGLKYPENIAHLTLNMVDKKSENIQHLFNPIYQFIEENRKKTNVLVHCAAGISRSSTILISYMMDKYDKDFDYCLKKIQRARPCCRPNIGFQTRLRKYQKKLGIEEFSD